MIEKDLKTMKVKKESKSWIKWNLLGLTEHLFWAHIINQNIASKPDSDMMDMKFHWMTILGLTNNILITQNH